MITLIILFLILRWVFRGLFWPRPWGMWGMPRMWHRPPLRGPHMGFGRGPSFGPGRGIGRRGF